MNTLFSISDPLGPTIFVERWKGRVLWGKRCKENLFISRQSLHSHFDFVIF